MIKIKKLFKFILILSTISLSLPLLYVANNVRAATIHKQEVRQLLSASDQVNQYNQEQQYTIIKSVDTTNLVRKTIINSKDYITSLNKADKPYNSAAANESDIELLAHLIESEAGDEPYTGKLAVGSVVMNREKADKETLSEVIFKAGQFDGVQTNNFKVTPCDDSLKAAKEILGGKNIITDAYYFADLNLCSPDFAKTEKFIARIGNHWFFKK